MAKIGLALGGGGARGIAHIGVLKILEKEKIPICAITGCSMGAVVGGLYSYFGSAERTETFILDTMKSDDLKNSGLDAFSKMEDENAVRDFEYYLDYIKIKLSFLKAFHNQSVFNEEVTQKLFSFIPEADLNNLKINFSAIATDLFSGNEIHLTKGNLKEVLMASAAIPGIFPPVKLNEYLLIDGSASESVPVSMVKKSGADVIIAVDVMKKLGSTGEFESGIEIIYRAEEITSYYLSKERLQEADLIISPDVKSISWSDFKNFEYIIKKGEDAAKSKLPEIEELLSKQKYNIKSFLKRLFSKS